MSLNYKLPPTAGTGFLRGTVPRIWCFMRMLALSIILSGTLFAGSVPTPRSERPRRFHPLRALKKLGAGEVSLAERFSSWAIEQPAAEAAKKPAKK